MKLSRFNSIDMLLQDPFFVKSLIMNMYNHVNPETIKEENWDFHSFLMQIFGEEAVEMAEHWIIPDATYDYMISLLEECAIPGDRLN